MIEYFKCFILTRGTKTQSADWFGFWHNERQKQNHTNKNNKVYEKKRPNTKSLGSQHLISDGEDRKNGNIEKYLSVQDANTHNKRKIIELFDKKKDDKWKTNTQRRKKFP